MASQWPSTQGAARQASKVGFVIIGFFVIVGFRATPLPTYPRGDSAFGCRALDRRSTLRASTAVIRLHVVGSALCAGTSCVDGCPAQYMVAYGRLVVSKIERRSSPVGIGDLRLDQSSRRIGALRLAVLSVGCCGTSDRRSALPERLDVRSAL